MKVYDFNLFWGLKKRVKLVVTTSSGSSRCSGVTVKSDSKKLCSSLPKGSFIPNTKVGVTLVGEANECCLGRS